MQSIGPGCNRLSAWGRKLANSKHASMYLRYSKAPSIHVLQNMHPEVVMQQSKEVAHSSPEADTEHLEDGAVLALDALQETWLWQDELEGGCDQLIVALGLWLGLDEV